MFDILEADIVCIQELKIQKKDLKDDMVLVPGWDCFCTFPKHRKGIFNLISLLLWLTPNLGIYRLQWSSNIHSPIKVQPHQGRGGPHWNS